MGPPENLDPGGIEPAGPVHAAESRLVQKMERWASEGQSEEKLSTDLLLVKSTQDVEPGDKVTSFAWYAGGSAYSVGTYLVLNLLQRNTTAAHHVSLELEKVE